MKHLAAGWNEIVLVCRSCSKKLKGGFGPEGDQRLGKAMRAEMARSASVGIRTGKKGKRGRGFAIIEVGCLDVCPKNGVVALRAAAPGDWVVVPRGASVAEVLAEFSIGQPPSCGPAAGPTLSEGIERKMKPFPVNQAG